MVTRPRTEAGLTVTVLAVNDAPEAQGVSYTLARGESVRIDFAQIVRDGDGGYSYTPF